MGADYESYAGGKPDFAKALHNIVSDPENWKFSPAGIAISFPEYSVTPRVEPVEDVAVPWAAVEGFLVKGFVR